MQEHFYSDFTQDKFLLRLFEELDKKDHSDILQSDVFRHFLQCNELEEYWKESVDYVTENYAYLAELDVESYMKLHYNCVLFKFIDCLNRCDSVKNSFLVTVLGDAYIHD